MRLSFSESIAFFLLFSPFGGISADEGDIDFVEQVDYSKRDNEKVSLPTYSLAAGFSIIDLLFFTIDV
jgi:hypothetical protein